MRIAKALWAICMLFLSICAYCEDRSAQIGIETENGRKFGKGFASFQGESSDFKIVARPPAGWKFIAGMTTAHSGWTLLATDTAEFTVKAPLSSTDFFGLALKGKMEPIPSGTGELGKKEILDWEAYATGFFIYSVFPEIKFDKVVSPWGQEVSFKAQGGKEPISWTLIPKDGTESVKDGTGREFKITEDDYIGDKQLAPGEYTVTSEDGSNTDSMTLVIFKLNLRLDRPFISAKPDGWDSMNVRDYTGLISIIT